MSGQYPDELRELVDEFLDGPPFSDAAATAGLEEAMRYSLSPGASASAGARLASARSAGADPDSVLPAAAAIELIHTYSLIHDDLPAMDDDDLAAVPTSHVKYGEDVAILAGDGLFAEAIRSSASARRATRPRPRRAGGADRRDRRRRDGRRPVRRRHRRARADAEGLRDAARAEDGQADRRQRRRAC